MPHTRGRGRPPKPAAQRRSTLVAVRVTPGVARRLANAARSLDLSISQTAARLLEAALPAV